MTAIEYRNARVKANLTLRDASRLSGISALIISSIENERTIPTVEQAEILKDIYSIMEDKNNG